MTFEQTMWVEKYRPQILEDMVLPQEYYEVFKQLIENGDIGNLLFYGPPGGGKTALARILTSKNGVLFSRDNLLEVNGSSKECRSINFVDQVIEPFLKVPPSGKDKLKIVYIDESDNMTSDAFKALRGIIEKYQIKFGRFIFTCNYISKIPDAIKSRFQEFVFKRVELEYINGYVQKILDNEKIEYDMKDVKYVVNALFPDIRKIVNQLQRYSFNGKLNLDRNAIYTIEKVIISSIIEIVESIKNEQKTKINSSLKTIMEMSVKPETDFRVLYETLFESDKIPIVMKIIINEYANKHSECFIPSQHFIAMIFQSIKAMKEYEQIKKGHA